MRLPLAFASGGQRHAAIVLGVPPPSDPRRQLCDDWSAAFTSQEHEFDAVPLQAAAGGSLPLQDTHSPSPGLGLTSSLASGRRDWDCGPCWVGGTGPGLGLQFLWF